MFGLTVLIFAKDESKHARRNHLPRASSRQSDEFKVSRDQTASGQLSEAASGGVQPSDDSSQLQRHHSSEEIPLEPLGLLRIDNARANYVSDTQRSAILNEISEVKTCFDECDEDSEEPSVSQTTAPQYHRTIVLGMAIFMSNETIMAGLPPNSVCDRLVTAWFKSSDPMIYIFMLQLFKKDLCTTMTTTSLLSRRNAEENVPLKASSQLITLSTLPLIRHPKSLMSPLVPQESLPWLGSRNRTQSAYCCTLSYSLCSFPDGDG